MYTQQWQHANKGGGKCNLSANINFCSVWLCLTLIWLLDCNWPMAGQWVILKNTSMQFDLNYYLPAAKWTSPVLPDCRSAVSSVRVCIVSPCPPPPPKTCRSGLNSPEVWCKCDSPVSLLCKDDRPSVQGFPSTFCTVHAGDFPAQKNDSIGCLFKNLKLH